jgi:hypothetical protein
MQSLLLGLGSRRRRSARCTSGLSGPEREPTALVAAQLETYLSTCVDPTTVPSFTLVALWLLPEEKAASVSQRGQGRDERFRRSERCRPRRARNRLVAGHKSELVQARTPFPQVSNPAPLAHRGARRFAVGVAVVLGWTLAGLDVVIQPGSDCFRALTCGFAQRMIFGCSLVARRFANHRKQPARTSS